MIYIFKTKLEKHPEIKGKLRAVKDANECKELVETDISPIEHSNKVRNTKSGRRVMTFKKVKYIDGELASNQQLEALERNPDLQFFDKTKVEEREELELDTLDTSQMEVTFSDSCIKPDGTTITLDDFPDDFSFGNGITVASSVPIKGAGMMVLSWVCFNDTEKTIVKEKKIQLQNIMEN